jgi:hypothetical protein
MCRSIKRLRGSRPVTEDEVRAAARQFVRKVSGVGTPTSGTNDAFEAAVAEIAASTDRLLGRLPPSTADRDRPARPRQRTA